MNKSFFLLGLLTVLLVSISPAYAIGISPARYTVNFQPGLEENFTFSVINSKDYDKSIMVGIGAPDLDKDLDLLSPHIIWGGPYNITFGPHEEKAFQFTLRLPATMEPGEHSITFFGAEIPEISSTSGATVAAYGRIIGGLFIRVPYPGIYAEITNFNVPHMVELNKENTFTINVLNRGKQSLSSVTPTIRIKDPNDNLIIKLTANPQSIAIEQEAEFELKWTPITVALGDYFAFAEINYDGNYDYINKSFTIGDLLIKITGVPDLELGRNTIQKIEIQAKSYWNQDINNVYAEVMIGGKSFKSESVSFEQLQERNISLFIDTRGIESGDYAAKATVFYGNKTDSKEFNAKITIISKVMFYAIIAVAIIIIVSIFVTLFLLKKQLKK